MTKLLSSNVSNLYILRIPLLFCFNFLFLFCDISLSSAGSKYQIRKTLSQGKSSLDTFLLMNIIILVSFSRLREKSLPYIPLAQFSSRTRKKLQIPIKPVFHSTNFQKIFGNKFLNMAQNNQRSVDSKISVFLKISIPKQGQHIDHGIGPKFLFD